MNNTLEVRFFAASANRYAISNEVIKQYTAAYLAYSVNPASMPEFSKLFDIYGGNSPGRDKTILVALDNTSVSNLHDPRPNEPSPGWARWRGDPGQFEGPVQSRYNPDIYLNGDGVFENSPSLATGTFNHEIFHTISSIQHSGRDVPPSVVNNEEWDRLFSRYNTEVQNADLAARSKPEIRQIGRAIDQVTPTRVQFELLSSGSPVTGSAESDLLIGNPEASTINGGGGSDVIVGGAGDDIRLSGDAGNDIIFGGEGNDTLIGGAENDTLYGGAGKDDVASYKESATGLQATIRKAPKSSEGESGWIVDATSSGEGIDTLYGIERIVGTKFADSITIKNDARRGPDPLIDAGDQEAGTGDTLDLSEIEGGIHYADGKVDELPAFEFANFEILNATDSNDVIDGSRGLKRINLGAGNDIVTGTIVGSDLDPNSDQVGPDGHRLDYWVELNLGDGSDIVTGHLARGSEINTGDGDGAQDRIELSPGILVKGLGDEDRLTINGVRLTGGIANPDDDDPWAYGRGGIRYGLNSAGQLVIQDGMHKTDRQTYIANYDNTLGGNGTAGVYVFEWEWRFYSIMTLPHGANILGQWEALFGHYLKSLTGTSHWKDVDPLVLDLNGDGIRLTQINRLAEPRFDIDGDGFLESTGWVSSADGFLVHDANANGVIDDVGEMFGNPTLSGFAELRTYDSNSDGVVDANDAGWQQLRVWRDANGNAHTDAGELLTLDALGISSISVTSTPTPGLRSADNFITETGTFTWSDGRTGTVGNVSFIVDDFNSTWKGNTSISAQAQALPELAGHGSLSSLRVAVSRDAERAPDPLRPYLADVIQTVLPTLDTPDLGTLRTRALPLLEAWAAAVPIPPVDDSWWQFVEEEPGQMAASGLPGRPGIRMWTRTTATGQEVIEYAYFETRARRVNHTGSDPTWIEGGYWRLGSDNVQLNDSNIGGWPPQPPATGGTTNVQFIELSGAAITFLERYIGSELPLGRPLANPGSAAGDVGGLVELLNERFSVLVARLAVQGPLHDTYFAGIRYNAQTDKFEAATDRGMIPVFEAVFGEASGDVLGFIQSWAPLLKTIIADFDRGGQGLSVTGSYIFANIVAAYESTGLTNDIRAIARTFGLNDGTIIVGTATTNVSGTNADDMIYVNGNGDQTFTGGLGADAYIVGSHFGHDVIDDREAWGSHADDIVRFADIKSTDITATRDGIDLVMTVNATGDTLRIKGQFEGRSPYGNWEDVSDDTGVSHIVFADSVSWDPLAMAYAVAPNLPRTSVMTGTGATDVLDGGIDSSTTTLVGGNDYDIYMYGRGYGNDTIDDHSTWIAAGNIVVFRGNLRHDDLQFGRTGASNDLVVTIRDTGETLTIKNQFIRGADPSVFGPDLFAVGWPDRIETFVFESDDADIGADGLMKQFVAEAKTDGNDMIYGFDIVDEIDGGAGNDYLSGGGGDDIYLFGSGYGHDTIDDRNWLYNLLSPTRDIKNSVLFKGELRREDLEFTRIITSIPSDTAFDLVVTIRDTGETLTIKGQFGAINTVVAGMQFLNRVEVFNFESGDAITADSIMDQLLVEAKTDGNDTIFGFSRADVIDGGLGDDLLFGSDARLSLGLDDSAYAADTYVFALGYGCDWVFEEDAGSDTVRFGAGITSSDVTWQRLDKNLVARLGDGSVLYVAGQFGTLDSRVESFVFADGTTLTHTEVEALATIDTSATIAGTAVSDWIQPNASSDVIDGMGGADRLYGGAGDDTFVVRLGAGGTYIADSEGEADTIRLDGLVATEVELSRGGSYGGNMAIRLLSSGETLIVETPFGASNVGIERITFSDGTEWDRATMVANAWVRGTSGNDSLSDNMIYADESGSTYSGSIGNDVFTDQAGSDTYIWRAGDGNDVIRDAMCSLNFIYTPDQDALILSGINRADAAFTVVDNDLILTYIPTGETITIENQFYKPPAVSGVTNGIEQFIFADTIVFRTGFPENDVYLGTAGHDGLVGTSEAQIFNGRQGDDFLDGGGGGDTFLWRRGDGNDTIFGSESEADIDTLRLVDVASDGVRLTTSQSPRVTIAVDATGETLTEFDIDRIEFSDGVVWDRATIAAMTILEPTPDSDDLIGTVRGDVIDALGGNDHVEGRGGNDTLWGGEGDDEIYGNDGDDILHGGDGDDYLVGGIGADLISGGSGRDKVDYGNATGSVTVDLTAGVAGGADGNDTLEGIEDILATAYDDILVGNSGANTFYDYWGDDEIDGRGGFDFVDYRWAWSEGSDGVAIDLATGTVAGVAGDDTLVSIEGAYGSLFNDVLTGDSDVNWLFGLDGDDVINAGAGDDIISGGFGSDIIDGGDGKDIISFAEDETDGEGITVDLAAGIASIFGDVDTLMNVEGVVGSYGGDTLIAGSIDGDLHGLDGDDRLIGGSGNDLLEGGRGDDLMSGGVGGDLLSGGDGRDTVSYSSAGGSITVDLSLGTASGADGDDTLESIEDVVASSYDDVLIGDDGANTFADSGGNDTIDGRGGFDIVDYRAAVGSGPSGVTVDLVAQTVTGTGGSDMLTSIEGAYGTDDSDSLTGNDEANWLFGEDGNDVIHGGDGDDVLDGGLGDDVIDGGAGIDTVSYDRNWWQVDGWTTHWGAVVVDLAAGTVSSAYGTHDTLQNVENAHGSWGSDTLIAGSGGSSLWGGSGNDHLIGGAGNDRLSGNGHQDNLRGGTGNDILDGGEGDDTYAFVRGDGADTIVEREFGGNDVAVFENDISYDQLWFSRSGSDLQVSVIGTSQRVTVAEWYTPSVSQLVEIRTDSGDVLANTAVEQLVQAMASLTPPPAGQLTLTQDLRDQLTPTLAATWTQR